MYVCIYICMYIYVVYELKLRGGAGVGAGERESLAAPGAFAGTAAVRFDVAAPAITGAKLLRNGLENVTFTGRQL